MLSPASTTLLSFSHYLHIIPGASEHEGTLAHKARHCATAQGSGVTQEVDPGLLEVQGTFTG